MQLYYCIFFIEKLRLIRIKNPVFFPRSRHLYFITQESDLINKYLTLGL